MLIEDLEDCLAELPPLGGVHMWSLGTVPDCQLATGAYYVTQGSGRQKHIIGAVYTTESGCYYTEYAKGTSANGARNYGAVAENALLLFGVSGDGSDRSRDISEIKNVLRPIPDADKVAVVEALHAALLRDHRTAPSSIQDCKIA